MKIMLSLMIAAACLLALPAEAKAPDATAPAVALSAADKPVSAGVIRIGERDCPAPPHSQTPDAAEKIMKLVSMTCVMEASGLISHDEAQSVYEQAFSNVQIALSEIQANAAAPPLASK